ncbi:YfhO family protein [Arthrobacter sp. CDRTa11]|uniref:hypothetical protein n=1 Tax=Arthrobacter sp. CDRTa11 TaxID=2651199 RepID=UPI002265CD05|nr:hypothetical protein [Arthrobacter sp. CDRTa11]UZX03893.1 YfhO family protein [Arthrobacter sp. CDRTa11]
MQPVPSSSSLNRNWLLLTAGSVLVLSLIPLIFYGRYYFQDDTENGAYGVWYHLGESLFQGKVPVLNPSVWSSGNYIAEGQWGTWNPLVMLFGVLAYVSPNAVILTTVLKVAMLVVAGVGTFVLARSYAVSPEWAFVAGIAVPLNGFTMYFDAPSWVTGALVWAIFPFFWAELRKLMAGKRNPFWAFITGYLIVTVGYVAGTVAIGFILLAVGIETLIRRAWRPAARIAITGLSIGLVAVVVFLPGVLTAAVTTRGTTGVWNDDYMSIDFTSLLMAPIATAYPQLLSWWWSGTASTSPAAYIAWFLPAIAFVSWSVFTKLSAELRDLFFFLAASAAFVLLPTTIGPLRYPARFMPYVAMAAVLFVVIALARARRPSISRPSLYVALGLVGVAAYLAWAQVPARFLTITVCAALVAAALVAMWWLLNHPEVKGHRWNRFGLRALSLLAIGVLLATTATTLLQHRTSARSGLSIANQPEDVSTYKGVLQGVKNDVIVVGDPLDYPQEKKTWEQTLMANAWYLSDASVVNRYQLVGFSRLNQLLCLRYLGGTCPELADKLFDRRAQTGLLLVDELQIDNIQILKESFNKPQVPMASNNYVSRDEEVEIPPVPEGWHVAAETEETVLWSRDVPLGPAGGVTWTDSGTRLSEVSRDDTKVVLKVEEVPADGGRAALSRLPWPGYSVEGASMTQRPIGGYLLGLSIPSDSQGKLITISFEPPGWRVGIPLWGAAVTGMLIWSLVMVRRRRSDGPVVPVTTQDETEKRAPVYDGIK